MAHYFVDFFRAIYSRLSSFGGLNTSRNVDSNARRGRLGHSNSDSESCSSSEAEWLKLKGELEILRCSTPEALFEAVTHWFYQLFPKVLHCHVYLFCGARLEDSVGRPFPTEGIASDLINYTELYHNIRVPTANPFSDIFRPDVTQATLARLGLSYLPILHPTTKRVLSAIVFVSERLVLDDEAADALQMLVTAVSDALLTMQSRHHSTTLSLLSELSTIDDNIAQGHLTVIKHLKKATDADTGFLLGYYKTDYDFVLKAFDDKVVPEKKFPCQSLPTFQSNLNLTKPLVSGYTSEIKADTATVGGKVSASYCLIAPIRQSSQTIGFLVLLKKTNRFSERHVEIVQSALALSGMLLYKDMVVERERNLREQTEKLHQVAKNIFTHLDDLTILLKEIMQEARYLCQAERCSVFLLESDANELVAKVFDGDINPNEEVRISATEGIAGQVVQTGKILNIKDAYSHPLFYRGVDESTGFRTRSILCFPIKDERDNIIGAAQLCNKIGSPHFDSTDEVIAKALATYCCISIVNSLMYRDVLDAHNRVKLANELMVFHMLVPPQDVVELMKQPVIPVTEFGEELHLQDLKLSVPRYVNPNSMTQAVVSMIHELDFAQHFKIKSHTLARFILMVKKGYRDPPYHNWNHAFSVAHFAYLLLRNLKCVAENVLDELEALAFFVAALCHDIDHRGTSNSFQVASNSVLAALYSSEGSVMERHHFSQTLCILNTEGCNIFENVSRKEYEQLLDLIRDIILSTDIAHHLRIRGGLEAMAAEGFDKTNPEHKSMIMCLFMTSSDLSDQTKPWSAAKRVSKMLYKEFFSQGDLEKALGRNPMEMMDRERASIPNLQIGFIDHIVLPAFSTLQAIFPETSCLVGNINDNREHWLTIKTKTAERRDSLTSLDVFDFIDAEDERESNGDSS